MNKFQTDKILNTKIAHQKYSTPLVGIIIFLTTERNEVAVLKEKEEIWGLPESFARGDEYLEESFHRTISHYPKSGFRANITSCVLLSGQDYRRDAYQFNFVVFARTDHNQIKFKTEVKWVSSQIFPNISMPPNQKKLLQTFFSESYLKDHIVVPKDFSKRQESELGRLAKTKEIHAIHFPMPLITVDGLLLKFSKGGVFEGIILEKRSRSVDREAGKWAFPAGFVNAHETMSEALAYEVFEEIGISLKENQFLPIYKIGTGPYRDSRWLVWTQFLVAFTTEDLPKTKTDYIASQEVEIAKAFPPDRLPPENQIAFDHAKVLTDFSSSIPDYVKYAKEKIERNKLSLKN